MQKNLSKTYQNNPDAYAELESQVSRQLTQDQENKKNVTL